MKKDKEKIYTKTALKREYGCTDIRCLSIYQKLTKFGMAGIKAKDGTLGHKQKLMDF